MQKKKELLIVVLLICLVLVGCSGANRGDTENSNVNRPTEYEYSIKKPIIYVYGYEEPVTLKFDFKDSTALVSSYPEYNDGWTINAHKDGHFADNTGKVYRYLFWEGATGHNYLGSEGFCVRGTETADFLEEKLTLLGFSADERNDFISYWLPEMQNNPWNVISFVTEDYEKNVVLNVTPEPTNTLRVMMIWYPWLQKINMTPQELTPCNINREEPTIVEWGGMQVANFENH